MALASWTGLYTFVIDKLMEERREPELLLLLTIQKHADPFGFCFPSRKDLLALHRISLDTYDQLIAYLVDEQHIMVEESYDYRRRQRKFDFQVSPQVLYVRPEIQDYCQAVFDGVQERDYAAEEMYLGNLSSTRDSLELTQGNLFSTKDSQPESLPDSEPDSGTRPINRKHNQTPASRETEKTGSGARLHELSKRDKKQNPPKRRAAPQQPAATQNRKDESAGLDCDEFHTLLADDIDDDRIVQEIKHVAPTTDKQAQQAVQEYPRDAIVHWLRITATRRQKGELFKPGGFFFKMLKKHCTPLVIPEPQNPDYGEMEI